MGTYRKDKNFIIISLDNKTGDYRFDINTGVFYGIKGSPIKKCPNKTEIVACFSDFKTSNNKHLIYTMYDMFLTSANTEAYLNYVEVLKATDKLDAIGFTCEPLSDYQYIYLADNIKALSAWLKEHEEERFAYGEFKEWCEFEKIRHQLGSFANYLTKDMYYALTPYDLAPADFEVCVYYLGKGKYWEYHQGNICSLINYIEMCHFLNKTPEKVNNFMREYCETKQYYLLRKKEFDNKQIIENYAKHEKAWHFSYGNHTVIIPTTADDIITEGQKMHHCVGTYVSNVVENCTYICFIRQKDNPEKPYITCQVSTEGEIEQYFLAYDNYISSDEDKAFKKAFADYLGEVWNK